MNPEEISNSYMKPQKILCDIQNCKEEAVLIALIDYKQTILCENHYLKTDDYLKKVLTYLKKDCPKCHNPMNISEDDLSEQESKYYFTCYDCNYEEEIKG